MGKKLALNNKKKKKKKKKKTRGVKENTKGGRGKATEGGGRNLVKENRTIYRSS